MKKIRIIILVALVVIGAGLYVQNRKNTKTKTVIQTTGVKRTDFVKQVSSSGKTAADKSVDLKFQTSGKLAWVNVKEGQEVTVHQAIAGLDPREVQKNLEKALRDYSSERNDFEEMWRVTYQGRSRPEQALTDTVKRILEKNQWDLEKSVLDVELKHLAVEYATLVTPIAGIVTHIDTAVAGVNITPATAVFSIADPDSLIFEANVDEADVGSLTVGQEAAITLDAYPQAMFSGIVSYISLVSEQSSGGATVFPVKIAFDKPEGMRIGLNGDITIAVTRQNQVLVIPLEAIREDKKGRYVYRKTRNTYERVAVTVGSQNDEQAVIESGLSDDDTVVIKGFASIAK